MSISMVVVTVVILLLLFGAGQRVLDKMKMSDTWALIIMIALAVGLMIPPINIGAYFTFSIGGFLIPFAICIYLLIRTGWSWDLFRAVIGTLGTAGIILLLDYILPSETPESIVVDNVLLYGLVAGIVAYVLGRSRRNAFICSVLGITLASVAQFLINLLGFNVLQKISLGAGGAFDAIVISTLIAVGLAELIGKTAEKMVEKKEKKFNMATGEFSEEKENQVEKEEKNINDKKETTEENSEE